MEETVVLFFSKLTISYPRIFIYNHIAEKIQPSTDRLINKKIFVDSSFVDIVKSTDIHVIKIFCRLQKKLKKFKNSKSSSVVMNFLGLMLYVQERLWMLLLILLE